MSSMVFVGVKRAESAYPNARYKQLFPLSNERFLHIFLVSACGICMLSDVEAIRPRRNNQNK